MPICTRPYELTRLEIIDLPERFRPEWEAECFGYAKKTNPRFVAFERTATFNAEDFGGLRIEQVGDTAHVDADGVACERIAFAFVFGPMTYDESEFLASQLLRWHEEAPDAWHYLLAVTPDDNLDLYAASKIESVTVNESGETILAFRPKCSRVENGLRVGRFDADATTAKIIADTRRLTEPNAE